LAPKGPGPITLTKPEALKIDGLFETQKAEALASGGAALPERPADSPALNHPPEEFARYVREFEARPSKAWASFNDRTDYAVALIFLGQPQKAIEVLVALESDQPDVYTTAANLGTAYELSGDLENAMIWIGKGIERKPSSHDGTEWLHVAILQAKINLRNDPAWIEKHSVLEGSDARAAHEIVHAVEYQLGERLHFVQPTDPVVCDLFYQAALRVTGDSAASRRAHFAAESLRFGAWRKAEIGALPQS
jgi:tetratricopeptide (TPR) repeat protein